jgi:guanylate kinase
MNSSQTDGLAEMLASYVPSAPATELVKSTPILLLVGPTGAGKDSLKDKLLESGRYHHIISHTTRKPRINHGVIEQNGREYHFIDKTTAKKLLADQAFIEAKLYSGNLYGTSLTEIEQAKRESKIAMTDVEVKGVAEYKSLDPNVMAIFLLPPDFKTWQERLARRYGDVVDAYDANLRMQTAMHELEELIATDFYIPVINDNLNETYESIQNITAGQLPSSNEAELAKNVARQLAKDIKAHLSASSPV